MSFLFILCSTFSVFVFLWSVLAWGFDNVHRMMTRVISELTDLAVIQLVFHAAEGLRWIILLSRCISGI